MTNIKQIISLKRGFKRLLTVCLYGGLLAGNVAVAQESSGPIIPETPAAGDSVQKTPSMEKDGKMDPEAVAHIGRVGESMESENVKLSDAETLLWMTDQLKNVKVPTILKYHFKKQGTFEQGFEDNVEFQVKEIKADGRKAGVVNWFSGERNHYVPPYDDIIGNPVLGVYLQGDVIEMNRITEGYWRYFHRLIKQAFADKAEIKPVPILFDGRTVEGKQVRITPYVKDPHAVGNESFKKIENKEYFITVCDDIPGYLYEIRTVVPAPDDAKDKSQPLIDESLVLVAAEKSAP
jgi:hypothetical protein